MTEYVRTQHCQTRLPVEPRDAKGILGMLEEPRQLVVKRPASRGHSYLVPSALASGEDEVAGFLERERLARDAALMSGPGRNGCRRLL